LPMRCVQRLHPAAAEPYSLSRMFEDVGFSLKADARAVKLARP
jgi:hypothetical protein